MGIEEGIVEVPLNCLDFEDVNSPFVNQIQHAAAMLSSTESSRKTLEKGPLFSWGHIVNVVEKHDRFGMGYHPAFRHQSARGARSSI